MQLLALLQRAALCRVTLPALLQHRQREALQDPHTKLARAVVNFPRGFVKFAVLASCCLVPLNTFYPTNPIPDTWHAACCRAPAHR